MAATVGAVVVAGALEAALGEPPQRLHPVAWLGRLVAPFDRQWSHPRVVGLVAALVLPLGAATLVGTVVALAATVHIWLGVLLAGVALFVTTSLRLLLTEAGGVATTTDADLSRARERLRSLAGRDAADLSAGQVRSAAVESAAENLADGLVAPLGAFTVVAALAGALAPTAQLGLAAGAAAWVKSVNTLDSMLGYRSKPVGWAPARLDDAVMWLPARTSAVLLAVASGRPDALPAARAWLDRVPSPNSGWPMGVLAATASVRLEKPGAYVLNPDAPLPTTAVARSAVRTVGVAGVLTYALAAGTLALTEVVAWS
ncbi:adenosylcobinamide-phosphate synthase [Halomicrobium zhouii]|uniref:Probable cobalamin biosynthesis protein CobD n=1 Tax=Halomicrobium zhouii TaxID=767519 RepID=A0A1I6L7E9_9EURY|nr:CobD/CbiB family cobalamin biosynthesis protein [Halomicrobium zhouii]SFR99421.1 adenosylcobinamide-phosphate synthase [Halomicrobium zhouii]